MTENSQPASVDFDGMSFEQALALASAEGINAAELSTKAMLVDLPFIIHEVTFATGEVVDEVTGEMKEFGTFKVLTQDGRQLSFLDGSSGIYEQIKTLHKNRPEAVGKPIVCKRGLRRSVYDHPEFGPSVTYYLNTSA